MSLQAPQKTRKKIFMLVLKLDAVLSKCEPYHIFNKVNVFHIRGSVSAAFPKVDSMYVVQVE